MKNGKYINYSVFIDHQNFRELDTVLESSRDFSNDDNWDDKWLLVFGSGTDSGVAYVVVLGDENIAPVQNYEVYNDYSPKYPSLTYMFLKTLLKSKVSLSGINLSQVNLSGFQMSKVNLSGANLEVADLEGANLEGVST